MNGYEDEERGSCLVAFLCGMFFGVIGLAMLKFIIRVIVFIASHF